MIALIIMIAVERKVFCRREAWTNDDKANDRRDVQLHSGLQDIAFPADRRKIPLASFIGCARVAPPV
jgi:hypothetical protein